MHFDRRILTLNFTFFFVYVCACMHVCMCVCMCVCACVYGSVGYMCIHKAGNSDVCLGGEEAPKGILFHNSFHKDILERNKEVPMELGCVRVTCG